MRKYNVNASSFLNEDDVSFYLLGAIMSDGNVITETQHRCINIASKDRDWLEDLKRYIGPTYPIHTNRTHFYISFSDMQVQDWLISKGCVPAKSRILQMPPVPHEYVRDFVRGYFDGDGSVSMCKYKKKKNGKIYTYNKLSTYICSGSESFIRQLSEVLDNHELPHSVFASASGNSTLNGRFIKPSTTWRTHFNDKKAYRFLYWMYYDNHKLSMPRKLKKFEQAKNIWKHKVIHL